MYLHVFLQATPENERSCSMYEEIVDILKDIEKEEINNGEISFILSN